VKRDKLKRGYSEDQVMAELEKREPDSEEFIPAQWQWADVVFSFYHPETKLDETNSHLNVRLILRPTIPHSEFSQILDQRSSDPTPAVSLLGFDRDMGKPVDVLEVTGHATQEQVYELEKILCPEMPHLWHVCNRDINPELGKIAGTTGEMLQSNPLALTQPLIAYHVLIAAQGY